MRSRTATFISALALTLSLAGAGDAAASSGCAFADSAPGTASNFQLAQATLCLLNEQRAANSLPPLTTETKLERAATSYSAKMVRKQFFAHVSPGGSTLTRRIKTVKYMRGYQSWALGENLGYGTGQFATPARIVEAWMASPSHRENILDGTFQQIGIGIVPGAPVPTAASVGATYVTEFGVRY